MNKLQAVSRLVLIMALILSLIYWGYMFVAFPVVFAMGFANADLNILNFIQGLVFTLGFFIFHQGKIIAVVLAFIGAYLFYKNRFGISLVFSLLAIVSVGGIYQYNKIQSDKTFQESLNQSRVDTQKQQAEMEAKKRDHIVSGFYAPKANFVFPGYKEVSREYRTDHVYIRYDKEGDSREKKANFRITQNLKGAKFTAPFIFKEKPTQVPSGTVSIFLFDGYYGYVTMSNSLETDGAFAYTLWWGNESINLHLQLSEIAPSEKKEGIAQLLEQTLKQLEKVK